MSTHEKIIIYAQDRPQKKQPVRLDTFFQPHFQFVLHHSSNMSDRIFHSSFGAFDLHLLHQHSRSPLRAWNAADELLLQQVSTQDWPKAPRVLVINDSAGALAVALHTWQPHSWNDSASSRLALEQNLARNQLRATDVTFIPAHQSPAGPYDLVLIQLPKTLSLLHHQLFHLRPHITAATQVTGGGMVKHMAGSMIELFNQQIGTTHTSLAQKKARLVFASLDPTRQPPQPQPGRYGIPDSPLQLVSHANVFSQQKIDIGTRFLLERFPDLKSAQSILDLGCGNGALGIYAGWKHPQAALHFTDDSFLAVQSARESFALNRLENPAHFHCGDGLQQFAGKVDAILCNPPFHEGNKVHTDIAARLFRDAARHLNPEGTLYVVANRHLDYLPLLRNHFRHCQLIASNAKFVILAARKPGSG